MLFFVFIPVQLLIHIKQTQIQVFSIVIEQNFRICRSLTTLLTTKTDI